MEVEKLKTLTKDDIVKFYDVRYYAFLYSQKKFLNCCTQTYTLLCRRLVAGYQYQSVLSYTLLLKFIQKQTNSLIKIVVERFILG